MAGPFQTAPMEAATAAKPQSAAAVQTSVQITLAFDIAALQLTPSFKIRCPKVHPTSGSR
jgi:hypothetical protein